MCRLSAARSCFYPSVSYNTMPISLRWWRRQQKQRQHALLSHRPVLFVTGRLSVTKTHLLTSKLTWKMTFARSFFRSKLTLRSANFPCLYVKKMKLLVDSRIKVNCAMLYCVDIHVILFSDVPVRDCNGNELTCYCLTTRGKGIHYDMQQLNKRSCSARYQSWCWCFNPHALNLCV